MHHSERITSIPAVMLGKPCIKGTRVTVEHILQMLSDGATFQDIQEGYEQLTDADLRAALQYSVT